MSEESIARLLAGNRRALARVLTEVENCTPAGREALRRLFPRTGQAHIIGLTGAPGSGKSTLVGALAREFRARGKRVGIVAVDPSSSVTRGAILGDRIRMQQLAADPDVFVRSLATRGGAGGIAAATGDVVAVLDAAGYEVVLIETVGAGQDEVAIAATAQTTVVLTTPGAGDDIQALKAGILEIADILVLNKADFPRAAAWLAQLQAVFALGGRLSDRELPVLATVATKHEGVPALADALEEHRRYLEASGRFQADRRLRMRHYVLALAQMVWMDRLLVRIEENERVDELLDAVTRGDLDPYGAAERLVAEVVAAADWQPVRE